LIFVPLPWVVALLLAILLGRMVTQGEDRPADRRFVALIAAYAVLSVVIGLRWGYGIEAVLPLQSILAALLPPLAWLCFSGLAAAGRQRLWPHTLPACLVLVLMALWPDPIDVVIIATYLAYGLALVRLALVGPDALRLAPLDEAPLVHRALQVTAAALLASAFLDLVISLDHQWWGGDHAALLVGLANMPVLLLLGAAAAVAGRKKAPAAEPAPPALPLPDGEDLEIVRQIDALMHTRRVFREPDLNLDRLARKAGIPARRISAAVNRLRNRNVSQYVNDHRIAEACRLLAGTDLPVTTIMFEVGFQTKSNFNREFRRVTGTSPVAWRAGQGGAAQADASASTGPG
jgi:AraC-like DNA-binding protein